MTLSSSAARRIRFAYRTASVGAVALSLVFLLRQFRVLHGEMVWEQVDLVLTMIAAGSAFRVFFLRAWLSLNLEDGLSRSELKQRSLGLQRTWAIGWLGRYLPARVGWYLAGHRGLREAGYSHSASVRKLLTESSLSALIAIAVGSGLALVPIYSGRAELAERHASAVGLLAIVLVLCLFALGVLLVTQGEIRRKQLGRAGIYLFLGNLGSLVSIWLALAVAAEESSWTLVFSVSGANLLSGALASVIAVVPGGLAVKEVLLILLSRQFLSSESALQIAVVLRVSSVAADLICATVVGMLAGRRRVLGGRVDRY